MNYDKSIPMQCWSIPAELGDLYAAENGQLVADRYTERVTVRFGNRSSEIVKTGKRAIALPAAETN